MNEIVWTKLQLGKLMLRVALIKITPEIAKEWLEGAGNYRRTDYARTVLYERAIKTGIWELNGETIKLDHDGKCTDGRHRLVSCIQAGKPFISLVVFGVKSSLEVDRGKPRLVSDHLRNLGEKNINVLAAIIANVYRWEHSEKKSWHFMGGMQGYPSVAEASEVLKSYPELREVTAYSLRLKPVVSASIVATVGFIGHLHSECPIDRVFSFIEGVAHGVETNHGDARHVLREMLIKDRPTARQSSRHRRTSKEKFAISIKAWNRYLQGVGDTNVHQLRWRSAGIEAKGKSSGSEPFPCFISKEELEDL